jgi:mercuric ion binding protein
MKATSLFLFLFLLAEFTFGQKKFEQATIQTSAQCGHCKERIESKLNYTKGIVFAELDLESKKVTVRFRTKSISLHEIKEAIADIGYSADDFKAKEVDILKLPKYCQPNGH